MTEVNDKEAVLWFGVPRVALVGNLTMGVIFVWMGWTFFGGSDWCQQAWARVFGWQGTTATLVEVESERPILDYILSGTGPALKGGRVYLHCRYTYEAGGNPVEATDKVIVSDKHSATRAQKLVEGGSTHAAVAILYSPWFPSLSILGPEATGFTWVNPAWWVLILVGFGGPPWAFREFRKRNKKARGRVRNKR